MIKVGRENGVCACGLVAGGSYGWLPNFWELRLTEEVSFNCQDWIQKRRTPRYGRPGVHKLCGTK